MEMRVDAERIRSERRLRAWSQEHLASVANLGLRTIQRIEAAGSASNESISAIASALSVDVSALIVRDTPSRRGNWLAVVATKRLWILVTLIFLVQLCSPPELSLALVGLWAWAGIELLLLLTRRPAANRS